VTFRNFTAADWFNSVIFEIHFQAPASPLEERAHARLHLFSRDHEGSRYVGAYFNNALILHEFFTSFQYNRASLACSSVQTSKL